MIYSEGEMTVSALDSATSLLEAGKNLVRSVILTVRSCYVASTTGRYRHHRTSHQSTLSWRVRRKQQQEQEQEVEEDPEDQEEEEEAAQSLGRALRGSIRRGNYAYQRKPIFRAQF